MIKLVDLLKEITEGKQVRYILKEITSTSFLEDKILLRFPTVIAKDIKKAFIMAYESGCKGITVYREGSLSDEVISFGS